MTEPTPSGARIFAHTDDGQQVEITEGVKCLYDLVISSMDWGSGFISAEDAQPVVDVAKVCGFAEWEEAQRYVDQQRQSAEQDLFLRGRNLNRYLTYSQTPHEHVFSTLGKCMWPGCQERNR